MIVIAMNDKQTEKSRLEEEEEINLSLDEEIEIMMLFKIKFSNFRTFKSQISIILQSN